MKMDQQTKKKITQKRQERREILGELSEYHEHLLDESLTTDEIEQIEKKIDKLKNKIRILDDDLEELGDINDELLGTKKKLSEQQEKIIIEQLIKDHYIGYLIEDKKFIYCLQMAPENCTGIINPQFRTVHDSNIVPVLNKMAKTILRSDNETIKKYFQISGNDYYGMTGSFNDDKWDDKYVYNKMKIIEKFWVQPSSEKSYNLDFDFLLYCVGGGKQENIEHLEKWIAYKWRYPKRNANIPNLDIGGFPGGNGKGRFIELLKTIFTHGCVVPAALKELTDGFNATWETAVILYYDEPANNELPEGKLKNATGGEEQRIEKKGIDAYTADRNYNMIFTSNNPNGVVKLAGTGASGEDRRWSVMTTDKVMVDEIMTIGMDEEQAKVRTNEINNLIKNREEVSKWLAHLLDKHDIENMTILRPLHGLDYQKRFEDQKDMIQIVFDSLYPIFEHCGVMTIDVLTQAIHELTNNVKMTTQQVNKRFSRYLDQKKIKYDYCKNTRINLLWQNGISETVQRSYFKLSNSNTNFGLEYSMFSKTIPGKNTKLTNNDFIIGV